MDNVLNLFITQIFSKSFYKLAVVNKMNYKLYAEQHKKCGFL